MENRQGLIIFRKIENCWELRRMEGCRKCKTKREERGEGKNGVKGNGWEEVHGERRKGSGEKEWRKGLRWGEQERAGAGRRVLRRMKGCKYYRRRDGMDKLYRYSSNILENM